MRKEKEKKIDGTLLVTVWILLGLGLVILYSASAYNGRVRFHDPAYYFKKQLFASALGVIGMYAVAKIDYRRGDGADYRLRKAGKETAVRLPVSCSG